MKIGVIQASSQTSKNKILYDLTKETANADEVVNFGCFEEEKEIYSYVEISVEIGLLLTSKAVDFIVTGYPIQDAQRKMEDTKLLKSINSLSRISMVDILNGLDEKFCSKIIEKQNVVDYILNYGVEEDIVQWLKNKR